MADNFHFKRIADPVHGTIGLSEMEIKLLSTRAYQRLRYVKQLGLAHLVYPSADYSRLSHSLGVCHVTGRILESLSKQVQGGIDHEEIQQYRLAGLLHDIGHYPFSHAFEDAVRTYYKNLSQESLLDKADCQSSTTPAEGTAKSAGGNQPLQYLSHEDVGRKILEEDAEIGTILCQEPYTPKTIHSIFTRAHTEPTHLPRFANLISSDLDADRIDYLLRTALHTGLPYGSVDIDYLISQMTLDSSAQICLTPNAIRTVEHFLIGRYFDYQQVNFHKTVAGFEWLLQDVVMELLKRKIIDCSETGVSRMVESGEWYSLDDINVFEAIRHLESVTHECPLTESMKLKLQAITRRIPPKHIGSIEFRAPRGDLKTYNRNFTDLSRVADQLSEEFNIDRQLWHVWGSRPTDMTKVGVSIPVSSSASDPDALGQSVFISEADTTRPINEINRSLMNTLARDSLYSTRLYVLLAPDPVSKRADILKRVREIIVPISDHWVDG